MLLVGSIERYLTKNVLTTLHVRRELLDSVKQALFTRVWRLDNLNKRDVRKQENGKQPQSRSSPTDRIALQVLRAAVRTKAAYTSVPPGRIDRTQSAPYIFLAILHNRLTRTTLCTSDTGGSSSEGTSRVHSSTM